jgi:hypothetical protein
VETATATPAVVPTATRAPVAAATPRGSLRTRR